MDTHIALANATRSLEGGGIVALSALEIPALWQKRREPKFLIERKVRMMTLKTIGILSPGDMGHAVGQVLGSHGLRVITCLQGRSQRTKSLADRAHIVDV